MASMAVVLCRAQNTFQQMGFVVSKTHEVRTFSCHNTWLATVTTMALTATNKVIYLDSSCGWYSWTVHTVDKSSEKMHGFLYPPCPSCTLLLVLFLCFPCFESKPATWCESERSALSGHLFLLGPESRFDLLFGCAETHVCIDLRVVYFRC